MKKFWMKNEFNRIDITIIYLGIWLIWNQYWWTASGIIWFDLLILKHWTHKK